MTHKIRFSVPACDPEDLQDDLVEYALGVVDHLAVDKPYYSVDKDPHVVDQNVQGVVLGEVCQVAFASVNPQDEVRAHRVVHWNDLHRN